MKKIVATIEYSVNRDYGYKGESRFDEVGAKLNEMKCRNGFESLSAALANAAMMIKEVEDIMSNHSTFSVYECNNKKPCTIFEVCGCGYSFSGFLEIMTPPVTIED